MENVSSIKSNIAILRSRIAAVKPVYEHQAAGIKIVAVTKTQPVASIREAIAAGLTAIGENRVQEAAEKYAALGTAVEWHLVGHLQTNKAREAVKMFSLIHSVDSERLVTEIDRQAAKIGKRQEVLLEVNIGGESTKFGVPPDEVFQLVKFAATKPNICVCGLMTVAPFASDPEELRPLFKRMRQLFQNLREEALPGTNICWLSMGMTNDYLVAIEEGANLVRIGTAIFGTRAY